MANINQFPCSECTRVGNPGKCENKDCPTWREWFLKKWSEIHNYWRKSQ